jgi:AcrR family transcriptional regulator
MVQSAQSPPTASAAGARRGRRPDARRLEILRAAGRIFRRRGFAAAGMLEIAAEADLSPGNLYHYFQGKHEILYFCQDRTLDAMLAALQAARRQAATDAQRLQTVLAAHIRCILDDLEGRAAHLEVEALPADLRARIVAKRDRYEQGLRRLVATGIRDGEFGACDPGLVTRAMLGALNWTVRWFDPDGPRPAAEVARELSRYLVAGLQRGSPDLDVRGGEA